MSRLDEAPPSGVDLRHTGVSVYGGTVDLRLLGPVEVRAGTGMVPAGQPRQLAVLAALAVDAGRLVTVAALEDRVWAEEPPPGARRALYSHVARVRRVLAQANAVDGAEARLVRSTGGYVLDVAPDTVDLHRFRRLVDRARHRDGGDAAKVRALNEALDLWRGEPLAGVPGAWAARMREAWHQEYLAAVVVWAQGQLRLGEPDLVVSRSTGLLADHPLAEPLAAVLMRALHAAGRSAEALDCYAAVRRRLADELGADPGAELQQLHQAILRGELPPVVPPQRAGERPAQLPLDGYGFTGREAELDQLDAILAKAADQPTAVIVSAVSGMAGVGKTALAVHWAHRVRDQFPDGQLYLDLRGFDPGGRVMSPAEAVRRFLDALGVPAERIPSGVDAQAALYRTLLAGRRVLVLLDNARTAEQVRPLLPGSPGCLVVATSRADLSSLVATDGAHPLTLDLLSAGEARQLLARRLGPDRVDGQLPAVDEIIERCARLPLALSVVAARAAARPALPLGVLAGELRAAAGSLDGFTGADAVADVRAVFSWSHRTIGPPAARLFRLFGPHPGADLSTAAAASLAGLEPERARPLLAELIRAHLVTEPVPGRYTLHDLLRSYAAELAGSLETAAGQDAAGLRLLDHYLHSGYAAALLIDPYRDGFALTGAAPGVTPEAFTDHRQALAWFGAEQHLLPAVIRWAASRGFHTHAWQLAWTAAEFFYRRGNWSDLVGTQRVALAAARRTAARLGQAHAHAWLARAFVSGLNRYEDATAHYRQAWQLSADAGDRAGQAYAQLGLARVARRQGRHHHALDQARRALATFQAAGDRIGLARARTVVGWTHALIGDDHRAISNCRQAIALHRELGNRLGAAATLDTLGYAYHQLGDHRLATIHYRLALDLFRDAGTRFHEAGTLTKLGDTHHAAADPAAALDDWRQALQILTELRHPDADQLRARINSMR